MSFDNINTERILRSRDMSDDSSGTGMDHLEYPTSPSFGQIAPRIRHHQDQRGSLFALNFPELPFKCRRIFVVTETPKGMTRGKHAHFKTEQVLLCVSGKIEIKFDRVFSENTIILKPGMSVFHSAMEWAEIKFLEENSVMLSACSTDFDSDDYISIYVDFQALVIKLDKQRKQSIAEQDALLRQESLPLIEAQVPLLNLKANYESIKVEVDSAIENVISSSYYISGPAVRDFESQFATFVGTKHCVGCSSGRHALILALQVLGISADDEIIVQGNASAMSVAAIEFVGAAMVLVDHDDAYQLDLELLETVITEQTKAVVVSHMYGSCCDISQLLDICKTHDVKLIEDCSHAHGATWRGKFLGSFGDIATWSFGPLCNLGAYGEAGGLTTDDDELEHSLREGNRKAEFDSNLLEFSLDAIHAAVLSVKLQYVQQWNRRRQEVARLYYELLCQVGDITFPSIVEGCLPAYHQFAICTKRRDALVHWMKVNFNVEVGVPLSTTVQRQQKEGSAWSTLIPRSLASTRDVLLLPMCPMLSDSLIMHVVSAVKSFYLRAEADYPPRPSNPNHKNSSTSYL